MPPFFSHIPAMWYVPPCAPYSAHMAMEGHMIGEREAILIRRTYTQCGKILTTARAHGVTRDTVRRVLERDYSIDGGRTHRHREHPWDPMIQGILEENAAWRSAFHSSAACPP